MDYVNCLVPFTNGQGRLSILVGAGYVNCLAPICGGIFLSNDNGMTWQNLSGYDTYSFAVSRDGIGTYNFFAATWYGVLLSRDSAASWQGVNTAGLVGGTVALALSGSNIFVGTDGNGIWRRPISDVLSFYSLTSGWNLLSLPVNVKDYSKTRLFPEAASIAFGYYRGYLGKDTLDIGRGFWLKFDSNFMVTFQGDSLTSDSINVVEGWNIIGSITTPVPLSYITSDQSGMITSDFYGYRRGYYISDTIQPANGYWVKVNQSGKLILSLSSTLMSKTNRIKIIPTNEMPPPPPGETAIAKRPKVFALEQNYPNPYNPNTTISYSLPQRSLVTLKLYDLLGREVRTIINSEQEPGNYSRIVDANGLTSGVYFYRLQAGKFADIKKMLLLK